MTGRGTTLFTLLLITSLGAGAVAAPARRSLSAGETRTVVAALMAQSSAPLAEDPSCKADLNQPGQMTVAQALGDMLGRAALDRTRLLVRVDCFRRPGYPLGKGQEYCRLGFVAGKRAADTGYGLSFVMDWGHRTVSGKVECY